MVNNETITAMTLFNRLQIE